MVVNLKGVQSQALLDLLAQFPPREHELMHEDFLCEEVNIVDTNECHLAFDGSATQQGGGGRSCTTKLLFPFPSARVALLNNVVEYEALIIGLVTTS